jgi:hypothetical protein
MFKLKVLFIFTLISYWGFSADSIQPVKILIYSQHYADRHLSKIFNSKNSIIHNPKYSFEWITDCSEYLDYECRINYSDFNVEQFFLFVGALLYYKDYFDQKTNNFPEDKEIAINQLSNLSHKAFKNFNKEGDISTKEIKDFESQMEFCIKNEFLDKQFVVAFKDYLEMKKAKEIQFENSKFNMVFGATKKKKTLFVVGNLTFKLDYYYSENQLKRIKSKKGIEKKNINNIDFYFDHKRRKVFVSPFSN